MIREKLKMQEYFDTFFAEDRERVSKFLNNLETGATPEDRVFAVLRKIYTINLGITVADYSAGNSKDIISKDFIETIGFSEKGWGNTGGYVSILWMLSMGILLDINNEEFDKLIKLVDKAQLEDYLIDYLIVFRMPERKISNKVIFEEPYKKIVDITKMGKNEAQSYMKQYLEKYWYRGHKDAFWYDNHKSKHNTYFGYWSFESAAIVKIMNLDDSFLKECHYYPYDMAHFSD